MAKKAEETVAKEEPEATEGETPTPESTLTTEAEIPVEMSADQKEAFIQMRREIKELKDQLKTREGLQAPYQTQVPQTPEQTFGWQPQVNIQNYIDKDTGEFKAAEYEQALRGDIRSQITDTQKQTQAFAEGLVKTEVDWGIARVKYPELDTDTEFAESVWGQYLVESQNNPNISPLDVISKVKNRWAKLTKKEQAKVEAEDTKVAAEKETATGETSAQTAGAAQLQTQLSEAEAEELLKAKTRGLSGNTFTGTRYSKEEQLTATVERLKKVPWAKPLSPGEEST